MSSTSNSTKVTKYTMADLTTLKSTDDFNVKLTSELVNVTAKHNGKINVFSIQPHRELYAYNHGVGSDAIAKPFFTVFTPYTVTPLAGDVFVANGNSDVKRPNILAVKSLNHLQSYINALNVADLTCKPATKKLATANKKLAVANN